jgi:hypothetical protein
MQGSPRRRQRSPIRRFRDSRPGPTRRRAAIQLPPRRSPAGGGRTGGSDHQLRRQPADEGSSAGPPMAAARARLTDQCRVASSTDDPSRAGAQCRDGACGRVREQMKSPTRRSELRADLRGSDRPGVWRHRRRFANTPETVAIGMATIGGRCPRLNIVRKRLESAAPLDAACRAYHRSRSRLSGASTSPRSLFTRERSQV